MKMSTSFVAQARSEFSTGAPVRKLSPYRRPVTLKNALAGKFYVVLLPDPHCNPPILSYIAARLSGENIALHFPFYKQRRTVPPEKK